jgi:Family of unknown function (DUF5906)
MTDHPMAALANIDIFAEPPLPEEIDQRFTSVPWALRSRLSFEAYATRCRHAGREPDRDEWLQHLELSYEELTRIDDLIEARRERFCEELGAKFVIREYGNKARVGWFDERGELVTMSFGEFRNAHLEKKMQVGEDSAGKPILRPLVEYWLQHPLTARFERVEFRLGVAQADMPEGLLNLWRSWPIGWKPGWDDTRLIADGTAVPAKSVFDGGEMPNGYCDRFLDHMLHNMCQGDEELRHHLLGWMADSLWNPGPSDTAIILNGPQGSGKSFWVERFMEFFGIHALTLDDEDQLVGHFNKHLMNKSVIFADEAFFAGNRKHAAKLKTLVTRPDLFVEPKGVDGFVAPKKFRLVMASNDQHVIRAERDDRRNLVLTVDAGPHNQDRVYFAEMLDEWRKGGGRALFRWLTGAWWGQAVSNGKFRLWSRPVTDALQAQKDMSLSGPDMVIQNMLIDGDVPGLHKTDPKRGLIFVATEPLSNANRLGIEHHRAMGDALRRLAGAGSKSVREYLVEGHAKRQYRGFWLPPLDDCRRRWEAYLGRSVPWPADVTSWALEDWSPQPEEEMPF